MKEFNEIDQLFKERAGNFEIQVPKDAWSKISNTMQAKARRKRYVWFTSSAAIFIVGVSIAISIFNLNSFERKQTGFSNINAASKPRINPVSKTHFEQNTLSQIDAKKLPSVDENAILSIKVVQSKKIETHQSTLKNNSAVMPKPVISSTITTKIPINNSTESISLIETSDRNSNYQQQPDLVLDMKVPPIDSVQSTIQPLANNAIKLDSKMDPKTSIHKTWLTKVLTPKFFDVCYTVGVSYNYRNKIKTDVDKKVVGVSNNDDWLNTWSNQVLAQIGYDDRFRFSTGVKMGSFGNMSNFEVNDAYLNYLKVDEFGVSSSGIITAHRINNVISSSSNPGINNLAKFDRIKFQFYYIDIPINVAYSFAHTSKLSSEVGAGINIVNIYKNVVSLRKDEEWFLLGNVTNLRKMVFGTNLNYDVIYQLPYHISAVVGVNYQATFNSVNLDKNFIYRPYLFTFKAGGRYRF